MVRRMETPRVIVPEDEPVEGFNIDQVELEDKLNKATKKAEQKLRDNFWKPVRYLRAKSDEDPAGSIGYANEVEHLFLERKDFKKELGEEEILQWLKENLGRTPMVELNKKGIIVPIKSEGE